MLSGGFEELVRIECPAPSAAFHPIMTARALNNDLTGTGAIAFLFPRERGCVAAQVAVLSIRRT